MTAQDHIESLLHIATARGYEHRQPKRYPRRDHGEDIGFHLHQLDLIRVSWRTQNTALMFFNEADTEKVWNCIFRNSLRTIAEKICNGSTFFQIID